ncbi:hypothetical protein EVAR_19125_1 [Eumeta japonica]|uniref:Uncharacterized protein n=1 Tax=Eumeta variegata TaxID=151549 RepID=A0A4C1SQB2_EUMVA|nr:hypothetical protein EVAR_19125_1 [Eumeta japonica]
MVVIRDVLRENTDEDIVKSLKQNKHATADLDWGSIEIRVRFRKRARNDHECHPVLEVCQAMASTCRRGLCLWGYKRPVWDQSPSYSPGPECPTLPADAHTEDGWFLLHPVVLILYPSPETGRTRPSTQVELGAQHKSQRMGANKLPLVTTRNRRGSIPSPPSQPSESKIEEKVEHVTENEKGRTWRLKQTNCF